MRVRFLKAHQGFEAVPGTVRDVDDDWAQRAILNGVVEPAAAGVLAAPTPRLPPGARLEAVEFRDGLLTIRLRVAEGKP